MRRNRLFLLPLIVLFFDTSNPVFGQGREGVFVPVPPCRVVDSRIGFRMNGPLTPGAPQSVTFRGVCGIPGLTDDGGSEVNQATALALNVVAVSPSGVGHVTAWPANQPAPFASILNYSPGQSLANGVIVPMCDQELVAPCAAGDISFSSAVSPTHLVVDVTGYYIKPVYVGSHRNGAGPGADSFLCVNPSQGVRYGLSSRFAHYADASFLCPAGTWVCTREERGTVGCNTTRQDSTCDARTCGGTCIDDPADDHRGWTHTAFNLIGAAESVNENGVISGTSPCELRPAWCCSKN
jgi:hypothetical protein